MSNRVLNFVWDRSPSEGTELLVLLSLADQANDEGDCWPSVRSLCKRARIDRRYAQRIIRNLAARGEIEITRRKRPDGSDTSNSYRIILPSDGTAVYRPQGGGLETTGGAVYKPQGGRSGDRGGSGLETAGGVVPEPPQEPSFNHQLNREIEPLSQTPLSELVKTKSKAPKGGDK